MKAGTVDPVLDRNSVSELRLSRGGSGGGKGNNGGGDNGHDQPNQDDFVNAGSPDKARIVTWFLLLAVLMTFGGMIGAYVVIATNGAAEWQPFQLPVQTWISTALIIVSSFTYHVAKVAFFRGDYARTKNYLIATTVLGAAFISSQLLVWLALVNRGFYMKGNPYAGFFYILTAVHAVHVIGGIVALGTVLLRTWEPTESRNELWYRRNLTRSVGWYWHFMGALWIVLFILLGFWK
jgi:cytochrome c oxidase subunit 3